MKRSLLSRHPSAVAAVLTTALLSAGIAGFVSYADASPAPATSGSAPGRVTTTPCPTSTATGTATSTATTTSTTTSTATGTATGTATSTATSSGGGGLPLPSLPVPLPTGGSSSSTATVTPTATATPTATTTACPTVTATTTPTVTATATPTNQNTAPTANAHVKPTVTFTGTVVSLSAMGSTDSETPGQLKYSWNFDNGGTKVDSTKPNTTVTFTTKKVYKVTLTVTDPGHLTDSITVPVTVYKRVDCQSNGVNRDGPWRVVSDPSAFGGKYCDNQGTGPKGDPDSISTTFNGTLFRIDYGIAHGGGKATIYIDGVKKKDFSFGGKMTSPKFGKTIILRNIPAGRHQLRIEIPKGAAYIDTFAY